MSDLVNIAFAIVVSAGIKEDYENNPNFKSLVSQMSGEELIELGEKLQRLGHAYLAEYNRRMAIKNLK